MTLLMALENGLLWSPTMTILSLQSNKILPI